MKITGISNAGQLDTTDFRLLTGADALGDCCKSGGWGEGSSSFLHRCGIATHSHGSIEAMGGDFLSVHLAALDDLPVEDLFKAPLTTMDGLHDNWQNPPAETRPL